LACARGRFTGAPGSSPPSHGPPNDDSGKIEAILLFGALLEAPRKTEKLALISVGNIDSNAKLLTRPTFLQNSLGNAK
jgi:hypothetical protein